MKKSIQIIYIVLFFVLCCTPFCLAMFFPSDETVGNEQKAEIPQIIKDGSVNEAFGTEFDDYFTQSIKFRPQFITVQNILAGDVLGKGGNGVIVGSKGWLFSDETIDDYIGVSDISDRGIHNISETVRIMQDYTEAHGVNFVFTAAPNKNQIYPEYMPNGYIKSEENNLSRLEEYLEADNINYVSLKSEMLRQKENGSELYLSGDTHWNGLGALYGYNAIMKGLGSDCENFSGVSFTVRNDWYGDISKMFYPSSPKSSSQYYFDMDYSDVRFIQPKAVRGNDELLNDLMSDSEKQDTIIRTMNPKGKGSLYISRDSFGRAMLPFLVSNYKNTYITRFRSFNLTDIDTKKYTDVVYEIVERKLDSITDTVPVIYAPETEKPNGKVISSDDNNTIKILSDGKGLKVYGLLESSEVSDNARIYISVSINGSEKYYEAFPITETELLGISKSDYGFSALIEGLSENIPKDDISVIVGD